MNHKLLLIVPAALALGLALTLDLVDAHTPQISAGCVDGKPVGNVNLQQYPPGSTVTVNGVTTTFGATSHGGQPTGSYVHTYQLGSPTVAHAFHVVVVSPDGIGNLNETETAPPCVATSTTTTPAPSTSSTVVPALTAPTPTGTPTTASPPTNATPQPTGSNAATTTEPVATTATSSPSTPDDTSSTTTTLLASIAPTPHSNTSTPARATAALPATL